MTFGPRVYQKGFLVIALVRVCVRLSLRRQGGQESKKHVDLIQKIHRCDVNPFYDMSILLCLEVISVSMCWPFEFSLVILGGHF